jgi:cell division protein FtsB
MMGVLVLAVVVLAPSIAAYAAQRQQIAELKAEVARQEAEVAQLRDQRERWNDETYIVTQARERLYYVLPGEVSYLVIDDRSPEVLADADRAVSGEVTEQQGDWMQILLRSAMTAGLTPAVRMLRQAREMGMQTMIGCMVESSVGISAGAQLLPLLDYADLDGAVLLNEDPAEGVQVRQGKIILSDRSGTGAWLQEN